MNLERLQNLIRLIRNKVFYKIKKMNKEYWMHEDLNIQKIEIYEYGNGIYAEPFWNRVQKKVDKIKEEYEIIDMDKKFIPAHYLGKNCMGMDVYKADELFLTLYCKRNSK